MLYRLHSMKVISSKQQQKWKRDKNQKVKHLKRWQQMASCFSFLSKVWMQNNSNYYYWAQICLRKWCAIKKIDAQQILELYIYKCSVKAGTLDMCSWINWSFFYSAIWQIPTVRLKQMQWLGNKMLTPMVTEYYFIFESMLPSQFCRNCLLFSTSLRTQSTIVSLKSDKIQRLKVKNTKL